MYSKPTTSPHSNTATRGHRRSARLILVRLAVVLVLGLIFFANLSPGMRLQWANLLTLCGF